jgi:hypothetical protein
VERYIAAKLAEDDSLSARSINMTVILLGAILEGAVERELIVRERTPLRSYPGDGGADSGAARCR